MGQLQERADAADPSRGRPRIAALRRAGQTQLADQYLQAWLAYDQATGIVQALLAARTDRETVAPELRSALDCAEEVLQDLERVDAQARAWLQHGGVS